MVDTILHKPSDEIHTQSGDETDVQRVSNKVPSLHERDGSALISVIAPLENDADILETFVDELHQTLQAKYQNFEILLIDDDSKDGTPQLVDKILKTHDCVRYVRLSRKFGVEIAITAGFETAIGDYVVAMLPGTDPVDKVTDIINQVRATQSLVLGHRKESHPSSMQAFAYRWFYWFCNSVLNLNIIPNTTYFIALDRGLLNSVNQIKDKFRYVKTLANFVGSKPELFPYVLSPRPGKTWNRGFFESVNLGIDLVVSNSVRPLRIVSLLGLAVSSINLLYFGYIGLIALFKPDVAPGWVTLSTQMALAFFVLNIVLAVVCEYIGRILLESKDRPFYFVLEEKNSSVLISDRSERRNVVQASTENFSN